MELLLSGGQRILIAVLAGLITLPPCWAADSKATNDTLAAAAAATFGKQKGQTFDAQAVRSSSAGPRTDTMTVILAPGKGTEIKALVEKGQSFVFHWAASADVAVDMHGDLENAKDEYTSYAISAAQREASGTFTAAFDGLHGWFWQNRGKAPVTVRITVSGFQKSLGIPKH